MGTACWSCGCHITTSMFGDRKTLDVSPCNDHLLALAKMDGSTNLTLDALADLLIEILKKEASDETA